MFCIICLLFLGWVFVNCLFSICLLSCIFHHEPMWMALYSLVVLMWMWTYSLTVTHSASLYCSSRRLSPEVIVDGEYWTVCRCCYKLLCAFSGSQMQSREPVKTVVGVIKVTTELCVSFYCQTVHRFCFMLLLWKLIICYFHLLLVWLRSSCINLG